MIEKMKTLCIVTTAARKDEMLNAVRNLGVLHLMEKKEADQSVIERFSGLNTAKTVLSEYKNEHQYSELPKGISFDDIHEKVLKAIEKRKIYTEKIGKLTMQAEQIKAWGNFSPADISSLADSGFELHFYRLGKKEYEKLVHSDGVNFIKLSPVDKMNTVALINGVMPEEIPASEFSIPQNGYQELLDEIQKVRDELSSCEATLSEASGYVDIYGQEIIKCKNSLAYSQAGRTASSDSCGLVWISGYIPQSEVARFESCAAENKWAYALDDPAEDDDQVPTKIRYNRYTGLLKPVMDILGTVPGYRELDISFWFLSFFALFFAMIIGDAGYGMLFLILAVVINIKQKKASDIVVLLYFLSSTTIVWGSLTGTWFGFEEAMNIPFLKSLVIPAISNYPELFGVEALAAQNNVMQFCFMLGTIQLTLACCISIKNKIVSKNLSLLADIGWLIAINALYYVVLLLVIGQSVNIAVCAVLVVAGFLMVCLFGGMSPDKTFAQGLKAGLADTFTNFLNTISAFGNVMSYIRLFAVGMASLAIAQSFNNMGSGFSGPLKVVGILIIVIGHALNLVMGLLSVVVHGVRLNLLEFSGQVGMEWSGIEYEPFKNLDK